MWHCDFSLLTNRNIKIRANNYFSVLISSRQVILAGFPPKEVTEDPLYNFEYVDGKKVTIGYEARSNNPTTCMGGKPARITCLEEINTEK